MRKNIKTCIYVITAILPIVLSACSNKTADIPKPTKESTTTSTTVIEDITSSDIVNTTVETTTEEDTTELISETEQEVINSIENITEQQQTQINVQQTTTVTSVNSTPAPVQTTPRPTETTPPRPTETTTPDKSLYKIKDVIGLGEKYTYNGIEFKISGLTFYNDSHSYCSLHISIINKNILDDPNSYDETGLYGSKLYTKYEVYDSEGICVKTDFCENDIRSIMNGFGDMINIDISDLPSTGYTIKLLNYQ